MIERHTSRHQFGERRMTGRTASPLTLAFIVALIVTPLWFKFLKK